MAMKPKAPNLRQRALEVLKHEAFTADEVAHALGESILSIRPRIAELHEMGCIFDTGVRRDNGTGKTAIVWTAKIG
jgi:predicted ArsR family transcriptional regulator